MSGRITLRQDHLASLRGLVFDRPDVEGAAFVLCGESRSAGIDKLISHAVIPIAAEDYLRREPLGLSINSRALMRITKLASHEGLSVLFAHSHPGGVCAFSEQDDREEAQLLPFLQSRLPQRLHGTVVLTEEAIEGRLYSPGRTPADVILEVGTRIRTLKMPPCPNASTPIHDRQVRAFGAAVQATLRSLRIGIVGLGGTGSPTAEQIYRLGVGSLWLFDGDELDATNLNRVYGATLADVGKPKAELARSRLMAIGLGTDVQAVPDSINWEDCARLLSACDVVFGCTDKQVPRAILTKLALQYCIPVLDMGVLIDSTLGTLRSVVGRVTTLLPGEACLFCRGRITPEGMRIETLSESDRIEQARQGYAPELDEPAPAVIPFTSAVASLAVSELLHRLTGFMGPTRHSSEVLATFDETRLRTNRVQSREHCMCSTESLWGRGDERPYLGLAWPNRTT